MAGFHFDDHLSKYSGFDEELRLHFVQFQYELFEDNLEQSFPDYQIPWGELTRRVFHLLHWPPKYFSSRQWSSFNFDAFSTRLVLSAFPGAKKDHFFHDYFCKRTLITTSDGRRRTDDEIYENQWLLKKHQAFTRRLLEHSTSEIIVVWGGQVRRWFEQVFDIEPLSADEEVQHKYRIVEGVTIGEKDRIVVFLPHPEYIQRWANQKVLNKVAEVLETLKCLHKVEVDLRTLEGSLRRKPELDDLFRADLLKMSITDPVELAEFGRLYEQTIHSVSEKLTAEDPSLRASVGNVKFYIRCRTRTLFLLERAGNSRAAAVRLSESTNARKREMAIRDAARNGDADAQEQLKRISDHGAENTRKRLKSQKENLGLPLDEKVYYPTGFRQHLKDWVQANLHDPYASHKQVDQWEADSKVPNYHVRSLLVRLRRELGLVDSDRPRALLAFYEDEDINIWRFTLPDTPMPGKKPDGKNAYRKVRQTKGEYTQDMRTKLYEWMEPRQWEKPSREVAEAIAKDFPNFTADQVIGVAMRRRDYVAREMKGYVKPVPIQAECPPEVEKDLIELLKGNLRGFITDPTLLKILRKHKSDFPVKKCRERLAKLRTKKTLFREGGPLAGVKE